MQLLGKVALSRPDEVDKVEAGVVDVVQLVRRTAAAPREAPTGVAVGGNGITGNTTNLEIMK